jgi:hypothetical protein
MLEEIWEGDYVRYNVFVGRKFDDNFGRVKDDEKLKEWIEILLLDRNVLIYFDKGEIRCTLKNIENIPELEKKYLERDQNKNNFFVVWEIEKKEFVTFYFRDVKSFVVRSENISDIGSHESLFRFRSNKRKISDNESAVSG